MTESKTVKIHLPCPDCGSSNALSPYDDGHTFCFSCKEYSQKQKESGVVDLEEYRKPVNNSVCGARSNPILAPTTFLAIRSSRPSKNSS